MRYARNLLILVGIAVVAGGAGWLVGLLCVKVAQL